MAKVNAYGIMETHGWRIKTPLNPFIKLWKWATKKRKKKYKWICEHCGVTRPPKANWKVCPVCGGPVIPVEDKK